MNQKLIPRPVITSRQAKDHLFTARTSMNEMENSIFAQRQKIDQQNLQNQQLQTENQKVQQSNSHQMLMDQQKNAHEIQMQKEKLNSMNALI